MTEEALSTNSKEKASAACLEAADFPMVDLQD